MNVLHERPHSPFNAMVTALSRILAEFSREVAAAIQDVYQNEHGK